MLRIHTPLSHQWRIDYISCRSHRINRSFQNQSDHVRRFSGALFRNLLNWQNSTHERTKCMQKRHTHLNDTSSHRKHSACRLDYGAKEVPEWANVRAHGLNCKRDRPVCVQWVIPRLTAIEDRKRVSVLHLGFVQTTHVEDVIAPEISRHLFYNTQSRVVTGWALRRDCPCSHRRCILRCWPIADSCTRLRTPSTLQQIVLLYGYDNKTKMFFHQNIVTKLWKSPHGHRINGQLE